MRLIPPCVLRLARCAAQDDDVPKLAEIAKKKGGGVIRRPFPCLGRYV